MVKGVGKQINFEWEGEYDVPELTLHELFAEALDEAKRERENAHFLNQGCEILEDHIENGVRIITRMKF